MESTNLTQSPDILLTLCPPWGVQSPPLGLAYLAANLMDHGISVEICDINILLFRQIDSQDREFWLPKNDPFWRNRGNVDVLFNRWKTHINHLTDSIAGSKAPIIGCSTIDPNELFTCRMLRIIKEKAPTKTIVVGGPACNGPGQQEILVEQSQGAIDYFLIGEGEKSLPRLVHCLKNSETPATIPNLVKAGSPFESGKPIDRPDLDTLVFPTFQEFNLELYGGGNLALMWSRGCIGRCLYCKERALWGRFRMRSTKSIIEEIQYHIDTYQITNFVIYDSAINGNPGRLEQICDEIIQEQLMITWSGEAIALDAMKPELLKKMYTAGCRVLVFGIESGSDKVLSGMGKLTDSETAGKVLRRTHEAGIKVAINILVGFPGESRKDFKKTITFLHKHSRWIDRLDGVSTLQIVNKTPLHEKKADFGIVLPDIEPYDKWYIPNKKWYNWFLPDKNTFTIRQSRLARILALARREKFEVGRTFLCDDINDSTTAV